MTLKAAEGTDTGDAANEPEGATGRGRGANGAVLDAAPLSLILLLAGVTALGPFSMQALAPALPSLGVDLDVARGAAQGMVSLAMLAMAFGAVVYGPLADHYGRRPVLLGALALSAGGALVAATAAVFEAALAARLSQAVGAGAGMVLARAAARDLFGDAGAAGMIANITAVMVLAPMAAPGVGGLVVEAAGWRGVFWLVAALSIILAIWVWRGFAETARSLSPQLGVASALQDYRDIAGRRRFWAHAAYASLSLGAFFIFVSAGPFVMVGAYGVGPALYGGLFVAAALVYMAANLASGRITRHFGAHRAILIGAGVGAVGCAMAAVLLWRVAPGGAGFDLLGGVVLIAAVAFNSLGAGIATPNAIAGAVGAYPERAASASSLLSVVQFSVAAAAAQATAWLPTSSGAPLAAAMAAAAAAAGLCYWALLRRD